MDNASKNAGEMIGKLQLQYNRGRQAAITNELVDIITGTLCSLPCGIPAADAAVQVPAHSRRRNGRVSAYTHRPACTRRLIHIRFRTFSFQLDVKFTEGDAPSTREHTLATASLPRGCYKELSTRRCLDPMDPRHSLSAYVHLAESMRP
jgi:hypothetical protein